MLPVVFLLPFLVLRLPAVFDMLWHALLTFLCSLNWIVSFLEIQGFGGQNEFAVLGKIQFVIGSLLGPLLRFRFVLSPATASAFPVAIKV